GTETAANRLSCVGAPPKTQDVVGTFGHADLRRQIVIVGRNIARHHRRDREGVQMATVLAPRVYGLDAICAAALAIGGEEAAHFARRLYARVADKDLAAAPADQRA